MKKIIFTSIALIISIFCYGDNTPSYSPSQTVEFARKDDSSLCMDIYRSSADSISRAGKPAIMFVFGGGFIGGNRSASRYLPWFKLLNDNGYDLVTIDYRLGLKGKKLSFNIFGIFKTFRATKRAVEMGVEDVYSAVCFLSQHPELNIDINNLVLSGSSAGAMISLSSEHEICNHSERAAVLPEGFNFKGVISFAGAIVSNQGKPRYATEPCPQLMFHGTADGAVTYNKTQIFKIGIFGSNVIAKMLRKQGYVYNIIRYEGHNHDIADTFIENWDEQKRFLDVNVIGGKRRIVDTWADDPVIPVVKDAATLGSLYD